MKAMTEEYHMATLCLRPRRQAQVLEKHLSGYDENAHVPSRMDASSKLAPASASSDTTADKVWAVSVLSKRLLLFCLDAWTQYGRF